MANQYGGKNKGIMEFYQQIALNHFLNLKNNMEQNYFKERQEKVNLIKKKLKREKLQYGNREDMSKINFLKRIAEYDIDFDKNQIDLSEEIDEYTYEKSETSKSSDLGED